MQASTPCTLCRSRVFRQLHDMGERRVLRCATCGLVRADPLPTMDEKQFVETQGYTDAKAFPEVHDFFANCHRDFVDDPVIRSMRRQLVDLERLLGGPGTLLDVGAGTGIFMFLARERGWTPRGVDICPLSAEKALREFDLEVSVGPFEAHDFDGQVFDAATMLDVLEHVHDPLQTLRQVHGMLRPGGAVAIAVPNQRCLLTVLVDTYARVGGPWAQGLLERLYVPPHLHYFTPPTLRRALEVAGFHVQVMSQSGVYLGRYRMSHAMRIPLETVLATGAIVGMNARLNVLATKR